MNAGGRASVRRAMMPVGNTEALLGRVYIDAATKGFPEVARPVPLGDVGTQGWTLEDLPPPMLALRASALEHNLRLMSDFCRRRGVEIAPHGKTTMAPQLWRMQLEAGAWGITAATAVQARVMRAAGVRRILIANELTEPRSIRWVATDLRDEGSELLCYVDSVIGVELLERGLREAGAPRPLPVLVELGHPNGRTGCRDVRGALEIAGLVARSSTLALAGVAGYEGTIAHDRGAAHLDEVRAFLDEVRSLASALLDAGMLEDSAVVTAGGSLFFDLVADRLVGGWPDAPRVEVLLRSGCYLAHDSGIYGRFSPFAGERPQARFRSAMEAWGAVLSRPEPGLALVGLGRRDVPFDQGYPRPLLVRRRGGGIEDVDGAVVVTELNDQHAFCRLGPDVRLEVGDAVMFGISHPCTAFDRWRVIPVLDDGDRVIDAVATFF